LTDAELLFRKNAYKECEWVRKHGDFILSARDYGDGLKSYWITNTAARDRLYHISRISFVWDSRRFFVHTWNIAMSPFHRFDLEGSDEALVEARLRGIF
jgi:hypothetical protein